MLCLSRCLTVSCDLLRHPDETALVVSPGDQHFAHLCPGEINSVHFQYNVHVM